MIPNELVDIICYSNIPISKIITSGNMLHEDRTYKLVSVKIIKEVTREDYIKFMKENKHKITDMRDLDNKYFYEAKILD